MSSKSKYGISLKRGFLRRFFWGALAVWLIVGLGSYLSMRNEMDELYDGEMAQMAEVLLGIYSSRPPDSGQLTHVISSPFVGGQDYEDKLVFQIWDDQGRLLMRSANAPLQAIAGDVGEAETRDVYGTAVRTLSVRGPEGRLIAHVGQNIDIRRENAAEALTWMVYILLFAFPVLLWLINRGINRGIDSLNQVSDSITQRSESNLSAFVTDDVPQEIRGIVDALNRLMSQLAGLLERERQFISDASHELRTPLSGIRAHAQLALKDEKYQHSSLLRIIDGVDRTTRLANQLLTLSGVDAIDGLSEMDTLDAGTLIEQVIEDLETEITAKSIRVQSRIETAEPLTGNRELLYIVVRNLLENAMRYGPPSGEITLRYALYDGDKVISVTDQGPGIPVEQRERVFDRFYRDVDSQGNSGGSGLGLAIVRRIISLHGGKIILEPGESGVGLCAKLMFR